MKRGLIIGIGVALVVPTLMVFRSKMTNDRKPTTVEVTPSLDSPTLAEADAPKRQKPAFPEGFFFEPPPREFEYLPEDKRELVKQAERENEVEYRRLIKPGKQDAAAIQVMKKFLHELDQRLGQILLPEEKFEYDLRDSILGQSLKSVLFEMQPTDEERRAIFQHRQEFEKRITEDPLVIDVAWKECNEKVRSSIGEERFKTYRMIQDATFMAISGSRWGKRLEFETKRDLYRIQSATGEAAEMIRQDKTLSTETKLERVTDLVADCIRDMGEILGDDAESDDFQTYSRSLAYRMESLRPRSPRDQPRSLMPSPGLVIVATGNDSL